MREVYQWLCVLAIMSIVLTGTAFAEEDKNAPSDWLERTQFGIDIGTDRKPTWYLETVQPLYQAPDESKTLFIQPRANKQGDNETYNLGLGYRWLANDDLLLGLNTFYDHAEKHSHYRVGVGLEAIGQVLEGRLNTYWALSDKRIPEETSTTITYQKAVNGADIEIGGPLIPHVPWCKLYVSGFWYDYEQFDDRTGWRLRTCLDPIKCIHADFIVWDDNKGDCEIRADIAIRIPFDTLSDISQAFQLEDKQYPRRDLIEYMLDRVERSYDVTVETWIENKIGGATVEIRRGN